MRPANSGTLIQFQKLIEVRGAQAAVGGTQHELAFRRAKSVQLHNNLVVPFAPSPFLTSDERNSAALTPALPDMFILVEECVDG
jgi:hypothetical protein